MHRADDHAGDGRAVRRRSGQQHRNLRIGWPGGVAAVGADAGAIGYSQAGLGRLSTLHSLDGGRDDAILETLQVTSIDLGDERIVRQADVVHGGGAGVGVRRRDEDVGRRDAGRLLDALADALRGGLADEDDVVGDEEERRAAIEKVERRAQQRVMDAGAGALHVGIAEQVLRVERRDIGHARPGKKVFHDIPIHQVTNHQSTAR